MKSKILLIEDDVDLGEQTKLFLQSSGFEMFWAINGAQVLNYVKEHEFDLLLVDVQMPDSDGFELVGKILETNPDQRFIFLTARDTKDSKIKGLKLGSEDYITKPFDVEELYWRINNILHRKTASENVQITVGDIELNTLLMQVKIGATEELSLTQREYEVWKYFLSNPNVILKREDILITVWGKNDYFLGRSLDVYIARMRKLLHASTLVQLNTIFKVGFLLKLEDKM